MLVAMIFMSFIDYYLTASGSGRLIHYTFKEQVADIYPSFLLALSVSVIVYLVGLILTTVPPLFTLIIQSLVGFIFAVTVSNYFNVKPFLEMKQIIFSKLKLSTI